MNRRTRHARRAFTMIEVIVVIIILGVMAAAIVPRFFGNEARAAEIEARQVKDFFDVIASRTALSSQGLSVAYDPAARRFSLSALRARGDAGDFSATRDYLPDPMTLPVRLQHTTLAAMTAGGQPVDPARGVELAAGAPRPTLVVVLRFDDSAAWRIELPADEPQALLARTDLRDNADPQMSRSVDLDATGATQQPW